MNRVLVAGGTGFIGRHVAACLEKKGIQATIVSRSNKTAGAVSWDTIQKSGIPKDIDAIVNCCGVNVLDPLRRWNLQFEQECKSSRFGTAKAIANAISNMDKPPKVFIQITGINVYPSYKEDTTSLFDENSHEVSKGYWGDFVREWEDAATPSQNIPTRVVFVRPGVVLGNDGGAFPLMKLQFQLFAGGIQGSGEQPFPWIHVDDLAELVHFCMVEENVIGRVNAVAPDRVSNQEFTNALAKELRRPALIPQPEFLLNLMFGSTRSQLLLDSPRVKNSKVVSLGYEFKFPSVQSALQDLSK